VTRSLCLACSRSGFATGHLFRCSADPRRGAGVRKPLAKLEEAVARALRNGASVRVVAELGLSANTVQKYGRARGRPTEENRERFYESRYAP
jgi:hypothetical protein